MKKVVAYWFVMVNLILDIIAQFVMMFSPRDGALYDLAYQTGWDISPTWSGTTMAALVVMLYVMIKGWNRDKTLTEEEIIIYVIIAGIWVLELVVLETVIGQYHWTKFADAIRWALIFMAAAQIYDNGGRNG